MQPSSRSDVTAMYPMSKSSSRSDVTAMYPVSKSSSRSDVTAMYPMCKSSSRSDVTAMYPVSKSPSRSDVTAVHPVTKSSSRADVNAIYSAGTDRAKIFITKSQMILCKLCLSDVQTDELYAFEHCKCTFCLSCVKEYLKVWITEGNVMSMRCPDGACKKQGVIGSPEIEKLVPQELFDRYNRLRFEREVDSDPNRTFCSRAGCEAVCVVSGRPAGAMTSPRGHPVQCPTCGYLFCVMCKEEWHADQTCDENMQLNQGPGGSDGIPFSSAEDAKIKRCPICRIPIERNDGCAQMMCKRCKHVFCWYCLASLDDDILLRHYDKGKCKNRLGHSRASVIWHRTQVVGIFAGFGVLLLVASPFLLLAAPCILCCKCKACHVGEEDDMDAMPSTTT